MSVLPIVVCAIGAARKEITARLLMEAMVRHLIAFDNAPPARRAASFAVLLRRTAVAQSGAEHWRMRRMQRHFAMMTLFTPRPKSV